MSGVHYSYNKATPCALCHKNRPQYTRPFILEYTERHRGLLGMPSSSTTEYSYTFTIPLCADCHKRILNHERFHRWRNWIGWGALGVVLLLTAAANFLDRPALETAAGQFLNILFLIVALIPIGALVHALFIGSLTTGRLQSRVARWLTKYADPNPFLSMPQFIQESRLLSGEAGVEELIKDLPIHRPQTIKALGASKDPRAFDALVQTFQFRFDPNVVDALLASSDQRTADVLLEVLKKPYSQSAEFRAKVLAALKTFGVSAERTAESVVASARSGVAGPEVVGELVELGDPQIVKTLLDALKRASTSNPAFKVEAISKLATLGRGNPQVTSAIVDVLQDKDRTVRAAAATALGELGAQSATEALVASLQDDSPRVRRNTTEALHKLHPKNDTIASLYSSQKRAILTGNILVIATFPSFCYLLSFAVSLESQLPSKDLPALLGFLSLSVIPVGIVVRNLLIDRKKRYQRFREQWLRSAEAQSHTSA